jgi:hypothetical protein
LCKKWVSKKEQSVAGRVTKIVRAGVTKKAHRAVGAAGRQGLGRLAGRIGRAG